MSDRARPDLEMTLPARPENVAVVRHVLGALGEALAIDHGVLHDIRLTISEACSNVIVHAYRGSEGLLDVTARPGPDRTLDVVVRDHGRGIGPRTDSPGLGVGLPLIAALAATVEIARGEDGCTEVRMSFHLDPRAQDDHAAVAG